MTRMTKSKPIARKIPKTRVPRPQSGYWLLQDAKARFSELVRKVHSEGPQHVTVHGRDEVVVIAAEEFRRLKGSVTGSANLFPSTNNMDRDPKVPGMTRPPRHLRCQL